MPTSSPTIFVVDDDESVRKSLGRLFRSAGYEVETFGTAREFLCARRRQPSVLILDLRIPVMNGIELQQELNARGDRIAVIVITAHDDDDAREQVLAAGALEFIRKPFDDERLIHSVEHALKAQSAERTQTADGS